MTAPPKYPRVRHVASAGGMSDDDMVLSSDERKALLAREVIVEEKLDGANVMVWIDSGAPRVGSRGGAGTVDRSGERGRITSWSSERADQLRRGMGDCFAVYGEWLRRRHAVPYDRLPAPFIAFDVLDRAGETFLDVQERDAVLRTCGLDIPPPRFTGRLGTLEKLDALMGPSAFGTAPAEGLIIRSADGGEPRVAKRVDARWGDVAQHPWAGHNLIAPTVEAARS